VISFFPDVGNRIPQCTVL